MDFSLEKPQLLTLNLGTGKGTSVMQVLKVFERITNKKIPYEIVPKRYGDSAIAIADITMAKKILDWRSKRDLHQMCFDSLNWQANNPDGFK